MVGSFIRFYDLLVVKDSFITRQWKSYTCTHQLRVLIVITVLYWTSLFNELCFCRFFWGWPWLYFGHKLTIAVYKWLQLHYLKMEYVDRNVKKRRVLHIASGTQHSIAAKSFGVTTFNPKIYFCTYSVNSYYMWLIALLIYHLSSII